MNAMREAFEKAGVVPVSTKLREMMDQAIIGNGGKVGQSTIDGFLKLLKRSGDFTLAYAALEETASRSLGPLMAERLKDMRHRHITIAAKLSIEKQADAALGELRASGVAKNYDRLAAIPSPQRGRTATHHVPPSSVRRNVSDFVQPSAQPTMKTPAAIVRAETEVAVCALERMTVFGRPLKDLERDEVAALEQRSLRGAKFYGLALSVMDDAGGKGKVGDHISVEKCLELERRAGKPMEIEHA